MTQGTKKLSTVILRGCLPGLTSCPSLGQKLCADLCSDVCLRVLFCWLLCNTRLRKAKHDEISKHRRSMGFGVCASGLVTTSYCSSSSTGATLYSSAVGLSALYEGKCCQTGVHHRPLFISNSRYSSSSTTAVETVVVVVVVH